MKRRNTPLAWLTGISLVAWIATGTVVYSSNCCIPEVTTNDYKGNWTVQDGEQFMLQAAYVPAFAKNDEEPIIPELLSKDLVKIVRYIKENPLKTVTIVGLFAPDETNGPDLGIARATAMRDAFIEAGTPPYQVRTESGRRDDLAQNEDGTILLGGIELVFGCLAPFEVRDKIYGLNITTDANFVFDHGSVEYLVVPTQELKQAVQQIAIYLQKHNDRQLTITGYNHPEEPYELAIANLGLARAYAFKGLLMQAGVEGAQITVEGKEDQRLAVLESALYGQFLPAAMGFEFSKRNDRQTRALKRRAQRIETDLKKRQVYRFKDFGVNAHKIVITDELRTYLQDLILYLSVHSEASLYCVGHSLPRETDEATAFKGKERANYLRDFLIKHGIAPERIEATTAADTHPLGTSDTRYGQQINRRVDLFVAYDGKEPKLYILPPLSPNETRKHPPAQRSNQPLTTDSTAAKAPTLPVVDSVEPVTHEKDTL